MSREAPSRSVSKQRGPIAGSPQQVLERQGPEQQGPEQIAEAIAGFLSLHSGAAVLEDGKVVFDLRTARHSVATEHGRCTLHLWSEDKNLVRTVVGAVEREGSLRLATQPFGQPQTKLLELVGERERRTPTTRETTRKRYGTLLERVLVRHFAEWQAEGLRTAMDLEKSFGPAYARGTLVRGGQAWAVIGVNEDESAATVDGVLTVGILWLHHCRQQGDGRRLFQGLKVFVPKGTGTLTASRMACLNEKVAQWELWELDQGAETMVERDADDQGNLRTRLVHHPDERAAAERFASAVERVMALVPAGEEARVEHRLRSSAELAFLLHGLEFARARVGPAANSFAQTVELTVGVGAGETPLSDATRAQLAALVADLFARRKAMEGGMFARRAMAGPAGSRRIGTPSTAPAHMKMPGRVRPVGAQGNVLRSPQLPPQQDPLYRAAPERWLESVLRRDLTPLTKGIALGANVAAGVAAQRRVASFANEADPDTIGNRSPTAGAAHPEVNGNVAAAGGAEGRVIPRLDPEHVYAQVPAIAGAGDRGMLDLLGVTADGRLAVIELKADEDMHFALQGLDYWVRVRHHHLQTKDTGGMGEFQRHGYFRGVELSPLPPRLYLVAPALRIHPATEVVLKYVSPRVEWNLLALDERWRAQIRVVWRRSGGRG